MLYSLCQYSTPLNSPFQTPNLDWPSTATGLGGSLGSRFLGPLRGWGLVGFVAKRGPQVTMEGAESGHDHMDN